MNDVTLEAYRAKLADLTDDGLVEETEHQVWLSAFANNNPRAPAHKKCDASYDEAKRRGKQWLYQRGWNAAYRSCGYEPSEADLAAARPPRDRDATEGEAANAAEVPQDLQARAEGIAKQ